MAVRLTPKERQIVNAFQSGFPIAERPFLGMAQRLRMTEDTVIDAVKRLLRNGVLGRVGAVVTPNRAGASTLAALSAPENRVEAIAELINAFPEVNHNYEREHRLNIWFVVTAPDRARIDAVLAEIENRTGLKVFDLPLEKSYHIDLGFAV